MTAALFLLQFTATLFMTGLIWFVQIVHYPLFATILTHTTPVAFRDFETRHANRTGWVVFPPMAVELLTALAALFPHLRPEVVSPAEAIASAALVLLIWACTGLLQVPLHNRLAANSSPATIRCLVLSNWIRTALWTARSVLLSVALLRPCVPLAHVSIPERNPPTCERGGPGKATLSIIREEWAGLKKKRSLIRV